MSKPKVLIFAPREEPPETINALEGMGCEVVFGDRDWQLPRTSCEDAVVEAARDAVRSWARRSATPRSAGAIMQASQRLRIVAKYTVGVDDIDTEAATDLGIMVCHAPTESNCFGVAETTITFMLSLFKKVAERDADVRAGKWRTPDNFAYYVGSRASDGFPGQTIGLVGLGGSAREGRAAAGALARAHHRLRSLCAAGAFPHPRGPGGRLRDAAAPVRRGVVPRRAHQRDPLACSARRSSS